MASTNKTENFSLNQWVPEDPVLREDFNQDNRLVDKALAGLSRRMEGTQKSVYDLLLQNHYDGKVVNNCIGLSYDGFTDTTRVSDSMGCGVDLDAKQLILGEGWCLGPISNDAGGSISAILDLHQLLPNTGAYLRFLNRSAAYVNSVTLCFYPQWGYQNLENVLQVDVVTWDEESGRPTDQVIASSGPVSFVPGASEAGVYCDFPIGALLPMGLLCLRVKMISTAYNGSANFSVGGCVVSIKPEYALVYDADKNLREPSGGNSYSPYYKFSFSSPESESRHLLSLPAAVQEAGAARIYVRHSAGSVSAAILDEAGTSWPAALEQTISSTELLGETCLESCFFCDLSAAKGSGTFRLQLSFDPGENANMYVYDYGIIWM